MFLINRLIRAASLFLVIVSAACTQPQPIEASVASSPIEAQLDAVYEVVMVTNEGKANSGTAIAVKSAVENGKSYLYLLTAKHVVDDKNISNITVIDHMDRTLGMPSTRKGQSFMVLLMLPHPTLDIAYLKIDAPVHPVVVRMSTAVPRALQRVYSLGIPMSLATMYTEGQVCFYADKDKYYTTNTFVIFGCSGGGVFDRETGQMIGVSVEVMVAAMGPMHIPITNIHLFLPLSLVAGWLVEHGLYEQPK